MFQFDQVWSNLILLNPIWSKLNQLDPIGNMSKLVKTCSYIDIKWYNFTTWWNTVQIEEMGTLCPWKKLFLRPWAKRSSRSKTILLFPLVRCFFFKTLCHSNVKVCMPFSFPYIEDFMPKGLPERKKGSLNSDVWIIIQSQQICVRD